MEGFLFRIFPPRAVFFKFLIACDTKYADDILYTKVKGVVKILPK